MVVAEKAIPDTYRVNDVKEIKCWIRLDLEELGQINLRREKTNKGLVSKIIGEEVKVTGSVPKKSLCIDYQGQRIYPV